jgi:hypothetical protein
VLVGQGKELTHCLRADFLQSRDQPGHHAADQLVGLQIQRRTGQARVTSVQHSGAQQTQAVNCSLKEIPNDGFRRRIAL